MAYNCSKYNHRCHDRYTNFMLKVINFPLCYLFLDFENSNCFFLPRAIKWGGAKETCWTVWVKTKGESTLRMAISAAVLFGVKTFEILLAWTPCLFCQSLIFTTPPITWKKLFLNNLGGKVWYEYIFKHHSVLLS